MIFEVQIYRFTYAHREHSTVHTDGTLPGIPSGDWEVAGRISPAEILASLTPSNSESPEEVNEYLSELMGKRLRVTFEVVE